MRTPGKMPGARGSSETRASLAGEYLESIPAPRKLQVRRVAAGGRRARPVCHRGNARFARSAVFEMFGYRDARAIDYDLFRDRKPRQPPRPSPELRRLAARWSTSTPWWRP